MNRYTYLRLALGQRLRAIRRYFKGIRRAWREVGPSAAASLVWRPQFAQIFSAVFAGGADVVGARGTNSLAAGQLEVDMSETILELDPNAAPLLVLSKRADTSETINPRFTWWEDKLNQRFDTVNGAQTNVDTAIEVNGTIWAADDVAYNTRTGEEFRVVSVAGGTLTVVRGVGSTATAMNDLDELIRIGSAAQEGALDKPARSKQPVEIVNYTQIFREPIEETGTKRSTADKTKPRDWDRQKNHAGIEHAKDIEYHALLGRPSQDLTGSQPRRTTGGFNHYATQNITDVGGTMTEVEFFAALRAPMRYGQTKLAMSSALAVDVVNGFPRSKLIVANPGEDITYGVRVVQLLSPHGRLNFVTHWLFEGTKLANEIWLVDLRNVGYRYLHGDDGSRDTHIRPEIQAPGADTRKDEYLSECGFVFGQPLSHGKIVNITG